MHRYLQSATLYTNVRGERLIRVHNLKLPATDKLATCFRYCVVVVALFVARARTHKGTHKQSA